MNNTIKWIATVIAAIILCSCTNQVKKINKAEEYYIQQGYKMFTGNVRYSIPNDPDNSDYYYILFVKDNAIYLDTEFKSGGKSAYKIYPNEGGMSFKSLRLSFDNGVSGSLQPYDFETDKLYNIGNIKDLHLRFLDRDNHDGKKLLSIDLFDGRQIFYIVGEQEALLIGGSFKEWTCKYTGSDKERYCPTGIAFEETFSFSDLYDFYENRYNYQNYTLEDYPFTIEERYNLDDLSFTGLSAKAKFKKSDYPWQKIHEHISEYSSWLTHDNEYFYVPMENLYYFNIIKKYIDNEIDEKEAELDRAQRQAQEEQLRQQQEQYRANIINNAIYFPDMIDDFKNPIKAEKKYSAGMDIVIKVYVDKIRNYSSGGYKYLITDDRMYEKARIYTNDENFAEIDYPCYVWIHARFNDRESYWDEVIYSFTDAQLLLSKKSSW